MKSTRMTALLAVIATSLLAVCASSVSSAATTKTITISVASLIPGSTPAAIQQFNNQVKSFEKANPNIKVQLEAFPFAEYHQKVSTAIAGNDAPDVFWMDIRTASFAGM